MFTFNRLLLTALITVLVFAAPQAATAKTGKVVGGMAHEYPGWFKESFLDFKEDAAEAAEENKHTILFMSLNGCPYCARMLSESFAQNKDAMLKDFDTIGVNIRGDREVMMDGENEMTEKQLARKLRVMFTPTIIFLDQDAEPVFRINGYWDPAQFRMAMNYVRTKSYKTMKIMEFAKKQQSKPVWDFAKHAAMSDVTDLSKVKTPLLVLFEDADCSACTELHKDILARDDVSDVLKTYTFVRLDARSDKPITDTDGNKTTVQAFAQKLGVRASPTFVAFDEGKERQRLDAKLYSHHFISILGYVSGKHYKKHDTWLKYSSERTDKILKTGKNVDLSDGQTASQ